MCFHWRELHAKKKEKKKEKRIRRNVDTEMCPEGTLIWAKGED